MVRSVMVLIWQAHMNGVFEVARAFDHGGVMYGAGTLLDGP